MTDIEIRYVFKRKTDGQIFMLVEPIENIESRSGQLPSMLVNDQWTPVTRELSTGIPDKDKHYLFEGDVVLANGSRVRKLGSGIPILGIKPMMTTIYGRFMFVVYWHKEFAGFGFRPFRKDESVSISPNINTRELERIGTIHEPIVQYKKSFR